ncbi:MAG: Cys/Met metabolism pyridoxal-phosphate-dependent enzyme [Verrucomicrobia bacterium]|nr:Cys/Met metabolism pyridoxal-phosphate-dependent enzyme [Verrucomicrobiota bacterium]
MDPLESRVLPLAARQLSPRRSTSDAEDIPGLVREQLEHFGIVPTTEMGRSLASLASHIYGANGSLHALWDATLRELPRLDRRDRVAWFNAKKFLCFQLAKLLDTLQNPFRATYQSLVDGQSARLAKGPYPIFDNVTALFSSTPVITRTATYLYACTEWIDDAFQGRETLLEVYSRLLNPTSISLANHIVDLECGPLAREYMAWNFNSGMAAIDAVLSHLVGHRDIVLSSRNIYGGAFQLLHDWYQKPSNLDVAVEFFDGFTQGDFEEALARVHEKHSARLAEGKHIYIYLESPCNPHGYVLDVPGISKVAHSFNLTVILDSTVATPFLSQPFQRDDPSERPDFLVHSYTKDICGSGTATAGCVIGRNERMFIPKGQTMKSRDYLGREVERRWNETLFWNVFYVKGAFLDADKAFEVINGSKTLEMRMLRKCVNTAVLARALASHPRIRVKCNALDTDENSDLRKRLMRMALPAPLFTLDFEDSGLSTTAFTQFFDSLEPAFGHQVSLGQSNTVVLCPALTSHSEMNDKELGAAGIRRTTIRVAVGDEDVRTLIAHFIRACELAIDPELRGFSQLFMKAEDIDNLHRQCHQEVQQRWLESLTPMAQLLAS